VRTIIRTGMAVAAALAIVVGTPLSASAAGVVRDDDGVRDTFLDLDFVDDQAVKRLVLPSGILSGATSATLSVYGQADACGTVGASQRLVVNGTTEVDFDPCDYFSTATYSWATFPVSISSLTAGTSNTFEIYEIDGDWNDRNAFYGVDSSNDFGRSDIFQSSSYFTGDIGGELMWYLTVVGVSDVVPPQSTWTTPNGTILLPGDVVHGFSTDNASAISSVLVTYTPVVNVLAPSTTYAATSGCTATSCNWSATAPLVPGIYLANARATDAAGNTELAGPTISIIVA